LPRSGNHVVNRPGSDVVAAEAAAHGTRRRAGEEEETTEYEYENEYEYDEQLRIVMPA